MFPSKSSQSEFSLGETSILYPEIAAPPLLAGVAQLRLIMDAPTAVAVREVGLPGTETPAVVTVTSSDGTLVPLELTAPTL